MDKLKEFLVKAKINTYATSGENREETLENGGKRLVFKDGIFYYQDIYYGFNPFSGQEVVWKNKELIWSMNYYGLILSKNISIKDIYEFLKKALQKVPLNLPFRGPANFKEGDFEYINDINGDINKFRGKEKILFKEKEVYNLDYYGGFVKLK